MACRYALQAIVERKGTEEALVWQDFSSHFETEALLHAGEVQLAREEVQRLGERLGSSQRFRIPYLHEADGLAADLSLPEEQWQIQAVLAKVYDTAGELVQARHAWAKAATIIQMLADGIKDETLHARFLAGPQIQLMLQHAQVETSHRPQDLAQEH